MTTMRVRAGHRTDVGRVRTENQDAVLAEPPLFIVADGVGGQRGGGTAARVAVEVMHSHLADLTAADDPGPVMVTAVQKAHQRILEESADNPDLQGMGTTVTAALAHDGGNVVIAHVGDSRAYRMRGGVLEAVTEDDSWVGEMVRMGELSPEEAKTHPGRNLITKALGSGETGTLEPAIVELEARDGDRFILCSDGLYTMLDDEEISDVLARYDDPQEAADCLVDTANERHASDNVSVVILEVVEGGTPGAVLDGPATMVAPATTAPPPAEGSPGPRRQTDDDIPGPAPDPAASIVPDRPRWRWLRWVGAAAAIVVVLGGVSLVGGRWFLLRNYYVACDEQDRIAVYRGVPHSVLGFSVSRLDRVAQPVVPCTKLRLPPRRGVTVSGADEAARTVENYRCQAEGAGGCPAPGG